VRAQYTYDVGANGIGRRSTMSNSVDQTNWVYDPRGRVLSEQKVISGTSTPFVTRYDYDSADRIISMTYPSGEVVTNTFNSAMQPIQMGSQTYGTSYITQTWYNAFGQPRYMYFGNGLSARY
jgi:YD repeat-containing protein